MKKQRLNDENMDNPSFMGFGTFNFDNSEVIIVTLRIGNRHLDLVDNYKKSDQQRREVQIDFRYLVWELKPFSSVSSWQTRRCTR
jgi:hypothetical protein